MAPYPAVAPQIETNPQYQASKNAYAVRLRGVRIGVGDNLRAILHTFKNRQMMGFVNAAVNAKGHFKGDLMKRLQQLTDRAAGDSKQTMVDAMKYIELLETALETSANVLHAAEAEIDQGEAKEQEEVVKWKQELFQTLGVYIGAMSQPDPGW